MALLLALCSGPRTAAAQTQDEAPTADRNAVAAQSRFDQGRTRFEANDFAAALPEFRASLALVRSPNTRLYIGLCLLRIGRLGEAHAELERAAQEAADLAPREPRYASTLDLARGELVTLTPRVARLAVQVAAPVAGLQVRVGDDPIAPMSYGIELPYTPGEVMVTAEAPGYLRFQQVVRLGARVSSAVAVRLQPDPNAPQTANPPPPPVLVRRGGGVRVAGVVLTVLGAASLGVFGYYGNYAAVRYDDLRAACGNGRCPPTLNREINEGEDAQGYANVALGIGIGAVVVGTIMIAVGGARTETRGPEGSSGPTARRWQPVFDPTRGMVGVSGAF